jgi:hypothetical protein
MSDDIKTKTTPKQRGKIISRFEAAADELMSLLAELCEEQAEDARKTGSAHSKFGAYLAMSVNAEVMKARAEVGTFVMHCNGEVLAAAGRDAVEAVQGVPAAPKPEEP